MFPFFLVADTHLHERTPGTRVAEFSTLLHHLRVLALRHKCQSLVVAGDLYDRNTLVSIRLIMAIAATFRMFKNVYLLVGNHDTPIRGYEYSLLDIFKLAGVHVISKPTIIEDTLFVPYYCKSWPQNGYSLAIMHKDIVELNPYHDKDWSVSLDDLPNCATLFNGHIHQNGEVYRADKKLVQIGSPYPCTWGDAYELNRFAYVVRGPQDFTRLSLNITADATAEDAASYAMQRVRPDKAEPKEADIAQVIEDIKQGTLNVETCLSKIQMNPLLRRIIKEVFRHADNAQLDGDKL